MTPSAVMGTVAAVQRASRSDGPGERVDRTGRARQFHDQLVSPHARGLPVSASARDNRDARSLSRPTRSCSGDLPLHVRTDPGTSKIQSPRAAAPAVMPPPRGSLRCRCSSRARRASPDRRVWQHVAGNLARRHAAFPSDDVDQPARGHGIKPWRERSPRIVRLSCAMNGQQRFLHDVVDPGHCAEPPACKLSRRRRQQHQQRCVRGLIASLGQPHQSGRLALLLGRHGADTRP